ncbi:MAG: (2Fe-2S) ferredoxin domain-containing protein [Oscillochloridaceae bacterium]|nr:(2Fe-2S) ferredoxin domain-containing protein [Chloroflexaceae bacterium]MDW8391741.1 (2Fe-2S) ferredoxin domain-containing protein [Oscillochloridaceae bacterium]
MPCRLYLCTGPHCAARGPGTREALENALWEAGLHGVVELHLSGCQDRCDRGPNLLVQPGNRRYSYVTPEQAVVIVRDDLAAPEAP